MQGRIPVPQDTASGGTPEQQEQAGLEGTRLTEAPVHMHPGVETGRPSLAPTVEWAGVCQGIRAEPLHGGEVEKGSLRPLLEATWRAGQEKETSHVFPC